MLREPACAGGVVVTAGAQTALHLPPPAPALVHVEDDPAFTDPTAKLRRTVIATRFTAHAPLKPTDAEIRAVQQAWAQSRTRPRRIATSSLRKRRKPRAL